MVPPGPLPLCVPQGAARKLVTVKVVLKQLLEALEACHKTGGWGGGLCLGGSWHWGPCEASCVKRLSLPMVPGCEGGLKAVLRLQRLRTLEA